MPAQHSTSSALAALDTLPLEVIPAAIITLAARLAASKTNTDDVLLTAEGLAKELRCSVRYVWKHWRALGGRKLPNGRTLRFQRKRALGRVA